MIFDFDEQSHRYRLADGRVIPGHTRVLDLGGLVPYAMVEPDILERKSALGREAHLACAFNDEEKQFTYDPRVEGYLEAWRDFRKTSGFVPSLVEHRDVYVINGLPFGMQIDRVGYYPKDKYETVVELKTCSVVMPHHGVQLAAQAAGVFFKGIGTPLARFLTRRREVVQLRENGKWKRFPFEDKSDFDQFEHCLATTYWKMRHEKFYAEVQHEHED